MSYCLLILTPHTSSGILSSAISRCYRCLFCSFSSTYAIIIVGSIVYYLRFSILTNLLCAARAHRAMKIVSYTFLFFVFSSHLFLRMFSRTFFLDVLLQYLVQIYAGSISEIYFQNFASACAMYEISSLRLLDIAARLRCSSNYPMENESWSCVEMRSSSFINL